MFAIINYESIYVCVDEPGIVSDDLGHVRLILDVEDQDFALDWYWHNGELFFYRDERDRRVVLASDLGLGDDLEFRISQGRLRDDPASPVTLNQMAIEKLSPTTLAPLSSISLEPTSTLPQLAEVDDPGVVNTSRNIAPTELERLFGMTKNNWGVHLINPPRYPGLWGIAEGGQNGFYLFQLATPDHIISFGS